MRKNTDTNFYTFVAKETKSESCAGYIEKSYKHR